KGSRGDPGNYRPVSLTLVPGKLVGTIVKNRIVRGIDEHNLLGKSRHSFCPGKSCLTNLVEGVNKYVDKGNPVGRVYLDFQKTFNKVPCQRLLSKVSYHGIRGKVLSWTDNWLKDRQQRIGINGQFSEWREVTYGVPQRSILGPILFNLFINDLEKGVNSEAATFADDTKLLKIVKTKADSEELQKDPTKLGDWARRWQMNFNIDKCKVMQIGKNNPNTTYKKMGTNLAITTGERSWSHCG
uniref:Reverse transcriptase domain-containing protein n=1 Tax=Pelodiscus sinensis TaxID=13735 RepID=K7F0D5_PELSI